ncbi:MAG: helix-turn-helix transcriptional regulator [Sphingobacteriaceae bacterium]|nr:helix-turn-helix transcriptional regulator [Sphingobacteriaceae bacterium]
MKEQLDLNSILKAGKLTSALDYERALVLDKKLRLLAKEDAHWGEARQKLRGILKNYEQIHWSKTAQINAAQISESDAAERIAEQERLFLEKRKSAIKQKMVQFGLNQQELGKILGHGKTYTSELVNGLSPFSMRDLVVLNQLFGIPFSELIPAILSITDRAKIKNSIAALNKPGLSAEMAAFS